MSQEINQLGEHFFRHEYGYLVASLTRKVGVEYIEMVEDAVQSSLLKALGAWQSKLPKQPKAWLSRVAYNAFIDELRKKKPMQAMPLIESIDTQLSFADKSDFLESNDLLHMIIICCDLEIPEPSRLVLCLKVLCGFNVAEIAQRLFITEANVHKRYQRARSVLRQKSDQFNDCLFDVSGVSTKHVDSVLNVLYVLFTEGYLSSSIDFSIRLDLCEESERLLKLLTRTHVGNIPKAYALLALMTFNLARMHARQDVHGALLLLEEQDRDTWNIDLINQGFSYLALSAEGELLSRYHLEAAIAAEHCRAKNFATTNWKNICQYYEQLEKLFSSYFYRLNRAIALAEWKGAKCGLELLLEDETPTWVSESYLWFAVAADLYERCGMREKAKSHLTLAMQNAPTRRVKELIAKRFRRNGEK